MFGKDPEWALRIWRHGNVVIPRAVNPSRTWTFWWRYFLELPIPIHVVRTVSTSSRQLSFRHCRDTGCQQVPPKLCTSGIDYTNLALVTFYGEFFINAVKPCPPSALSTLLQLGSTDLHITSWRRSRKLWTNPWRFLFRSLSKKSNLHTFGYGL